MSKASQPADRANLRVLLGVTGGIAAYKAAQIVRELRSRGHEVRCAMTRAAGQFVTPLTLEVLSGQEVYGEEYLSANGSGEELHIVASDWADVLVIAPATAHTIARLSLGLCDDFLSTTAVAFSGPVVLAPAMHSKMWNQPSVEANVETLRSRCVTFVGPEVGALASGESGIGRMAEPVDIVRAAERSARSGPWEGRSVLIAAGPTREAIDPVRFLSNRSSGRMGFALAEAAAALGATTTLVAGPVSLKTPPRVVRVDVTTAEEMCAAVQIAAPEADLIVMAAAVGDYRPRSVSRSKIKKGGEGLRSIELEPTTDILTSLRPIAPEAVIVGFAAETDNVVAHAQAKLEAKGADFIVANDVSRSDVGFQSDFNEVTVLGEDAEVRFERQAKRTLADELLAHFETAVGSRERQPG